MLNILKAGRQLLPDDDLGKRICGAGSYKSEQKISIALATAFANRTVRQTLVKTVFRQRELGISVGRFRASRRFSHKMKAGTRAMLSTSKTMFEGWRMFVTVLVSALNNS